MISLLCLDLLMGNTKKQHSGTSWLFTLQWHECLNEWPWWMPAVVSVAWQGVHKMLDVSEASCTWKISNLCVKLLSHLPLINNKWRYINGFKHISPHIGVFAFNLWLWNWFTPYQGLIADFSFGKSRRAFCVVTSITSCSDTPLILLMYSAEIQMFLGSFLTCNQEAKQERW